MARPREYGPRITTAIRFEADLHDALKETATELGVGVNWLVTKLCREGLDRMDLSVPLLAVSAATNGALETPAAQLSGSSDGAAS